MEKKRKVTVTVTRSSHPEFEFFGTFTINGRQKAKRGTEAEVMAWYGTVAEVGRANNFDVVLELDS